MSDEKPILILRDSQVTTDEKGNVCLNDLWKLAGEPENRRGRDWYPSKRAKALDGALRARIGEIFPNSEEVGPETTYYVNGRGAKSRTFAHPVLALDYAEFLNSDLAVEVREVFLRYRANDVTLALDIVEGLAEQAEYDDLRVKLRTLVKEHNKLSAGAAKDAGVKNFEAYNGAGLAGLYGGMTKADVLRHKGLPEDAHHLDHAGMRNWRRITLKLLKLPRN